MIPETWNQIDRPSVSDCAAHLATCTQCPSRTRAESVDKNLAEHVFVMWLAVEAELKFEYCLAQW